MATGCARSTKFKTPYPVGKGPAAETVRTLDDLRAVLPPRTPDHPLFWSRAGVTLSQTGVKGKSRFDVTLIHRDEPDAVRLRANHMLAGLLFEIILDGKQASLFLAQDKTLYTGSLDDLRRLGGGLGNLSPKDLIAAILVHHDLRRRLAEPGEWKTLDEPGELYLIQSHPDGTRWFWRVRKLDGLVRELVIRDAEGALLLHVLYDGYELHGQEPLPTGMDISAGDGAVTVRLEMKEYKTEPEIDPANVTAKPRQVKETYPLDALMQRTDVLPTEGE